MAIHDKPEDQWKYALGVDPVTVTTDKLPVPGRVNISGIDYLSLNFTRNSSATDVAYPVQASHDLVHLEHGFHLHGRGMDSGGCVTESGSEVNLNVTVWDSIPVTSAKSRFLRLVVGH